MNVNKDSPGGQGWTAASLVDAIANGMPCNPRSTPYVSLTRNHLHASVVTANSNGELWLLLGTDSGFEGPTALYYQSIDVLLVPINEPSSAPVLLTEANSDQAVAVDSVTWARGPFSLEALQNLSPDQRTRIILFARNVDLLPGEDQSVVTAEAKDGQNRVFPLTVEFVRKVRTFNWLSEIIVKLPDELKAADDVLVSISVHGSVSNQARISIKPSGSFSSP